MIMKMGLSKSTTIESGEKIPHLAPDFKNHSEIITNTISAIVERLDSFGVKYDQRAVADRVYQISYVYTKHMHEYPNQNGPVIHIGLDKPLSRRLPANAEDEVKARWKGMLQNIVNNSKAPTYSGNKINFSHPMGQGLYLYFVIQDFDPSFEVLAPSFAVSLALDINELENTNEDTYKNITQKISQSLTDNLDANKPE